MRGTAPAPATSRSDARWGPDGRWSIAAILLSLLVLLATQYGDVMRLSFSNDDYLILDKLQRISFWRLAAPHDLLAGYYRPWSRELHYWLLSRCFGVTAAPFHAVSLTLFLAAMAGYFALLYRLAGRAVAGLAVLLLVAQAAWGALLVWPAGAQDLWMLAAAPGVLLAIRGRRTLLAALAFAIALLSKESAATLPFIAIAYLLVVEREPLVAALRRTAALWPILAVWAFLDPYAGATFHSPGAAAGSPLRVFASIARTLANADGAALDAPARAHALAVGWPAAAVMTLGALIVVRRGDTSSASGESPPTWRVAGWLACWALLGWLPLLTPGLPWHPYYGLWGSFGACGLAAMALRRNPRWAAAVVCALSLMRPMRTAVPEVNLGSEWYQRRAAILTGTMHTDMVRSRPELPRHSRVYFALLPSGVGMIAGPGYSAPLRVWYADTTLRGYLYSQYRPRAAGDTLGGDFFFVSDTIDTGHLTEVVKGAEEVDAPPQPDWGRLHLELATLFYRCGDVAAARDEFVKLANIYPQNVAFDDYAAGCEQRLGNTRGAQAWLDRALEQQARGRDREP